MSKHIRFLFHIFAVGLFVPIAMHFIAAEDHFRYAEGLVMVLFWAVIPYTIGIRIYPYSEDCVGVKLDRRFWRIIIVAAIPFVTCVTMAFLYDRYDGDSSIICTTAPLAFYVGVYFYFRKHWKFLFDGAH